MCNIYMDMSCEYAYGIVARYGADVTCVRSVVLAKHSELLTDCSADLPLGAVRDAVRERV